MAKESLRLFKIACRWLLEQDVFALCEGLDSPFEMKPTGQWIVDDINLWVVEDVCLT